jgi:carboxymethylenebutenolidase
MLTKTQNTDAQDIKSQDVARDGLYGYLAQPQAPGVAGVLIVPTIFALNPFVRGYADGLARAGMTAAVCDLNSGMPLPSGYDEAIAFSRKLNDELVEDIMGRWLGHLQHDLGQSSLAILGFCLGGRLALMRATHDRRLKACAAAYPSIENPMRDNQSQDIVKLAANIRCPVQICQPGIDHVASPETYRALSDTLLKRTAPTIIQYYPEAEHGFMHRKEPAANAAATVIASPQVIAFLAACSS